MNERAKATCRFSSIIAVQPPGVEPEDFINLAGLSGDGVNSHTCRDCVVPTLTGAEIITVACEQNVVACSTEQRIVAVGAVQRVVSAAADQQVVTGRSGKRIVTQATVE